MKRMAVVIVATSLGGCPLIYPRHDPVIPPSAPAPIEGHDLDVFRATVSWSASPRTLGEPTPYAPQLMSPADERGPLAMSMADFVDPPMSGSPAVLSFASARDGGAGGLDLYWAEVSKGIVHQLEHLSSNANDTYMTYRFGAVMKPRVLFASDRGGSGYDLFEAIADADSRILVFSSNRPGGRGGYDLYAVAFQGCV